LQSGPTQEEQNQQSPGKMLGFVGFKKRKLVWFWNLSGKHLRVLGRCFYPL